LTPITHAAPPAPAPGTVAQQTALIRVAGLLIAGAGQEVVFRALARELGVLTGASGVGLLRYEPDGTTCTVGVWSATGRHLAAARPRSEHRVVVRGRGRERAWGEVALIPPAAGLGPDAESVVLAFVDLVSPAIGSAEARQALDDARERSVRAADRVRADIAEQLRSGPRRRLRRVAEQLTAAQAALPDDRALALERIDAARATLSAGMEELQRLARGIHPTLLSERGLDPALANLVDACPVRVTLKGRVGVRLAGPSELAAYYVVESALRGAAEHTRVTRVTVTLRLGNGVLRIDVADDGAEAARTAVEGRDLVEVRDRLTALGGELTLGRSRFGGTALRARIPAPAVAADG
jgi:signal transduction histidine kinase